MDAWSIITGLASVISLLFVLHEKSTNIRKYLIPFGAGACGFAIGRMTIFYAPSITGAFQDPALVGIICILLISLLTMYFVIKSLRQVLDIPVMGLLLFVIICLTAMGSICNSYLNSVKGQIKAPELIEFAAYKEAKGEFASAIQYLSIASPMIQDSVQRKAVKLKIDNLTKRQLSEPINSNDTIPK